MVRPRRARDVVDPGDAVLHQCIAPRNAEQGIHQPEIIGQPSGTSVWWGYGLYPERNGNFVRKRMDQCTGAEILEETLQHLRFDRHLAAIMASRSLVGF